MWKENRFMEELKKTILKEYSSIRIDKGDDQIQVADLFLLLDILEPSTLGDILSDIKSYKKTVV